VDHKEEAKSFKEVTPLPDESEQISIYLEREQEPESVVFGPMNKPTDYEELDRNKPTRKKKYPNLKNKYASADKKKYENSEWPSKEECKLHVSRFPDWAQLPTVYLPAKHKGFNTELMINEDIEQEAGTPHPLPWYPPLCDAALAATVKLPSRQDAQSAIVIIQSPGTIILRGCARRETGRNILRTRSNRKCRTLSTPPAR
jgi:hypothetical protein